MLRTELRASDRMPTRLRIEAVGPTLNISAGGMCILTTDPLPEKPISTTTVTFNLPDGLNPVTCKGRITYCRVSKIDPELYEVGIAFIDISDEDRQRIGEFIDAQLGSSPD